MVAGVFEKLQLTLRLVARPVDLSVHRRRRRSRRCRPCRRRRRVWRCRGVAPCPLVDPPVATLYRPLPPTPPLISTHPPRCSLSVVPTKIRRYSPFSDYQPCHEVLLHRGQYGRPHRYRCSDQGEWLSPIPHPTFLLSSGPAKTEPPSLTLLQSVRTPFARHLT